MLYFFARILIASFFIMAGSRQLSDPRSAIAYAKSKHIWKAHILVPISSVLLVLSGIAIIIGLPLLWLAKAFLIPFLVIVNLTMHTFWKETNSEIKQREILFFMYNCALIGALLLFR